jgi:hypothetical protein
MAISFLGFSDSRKSNCAQIRLAMPSSTGPVRKMIRSFSRREKMSKARSPRLVCSTTIGTRFIAVAIGSYIMGITLFVCLDTLCIWARENESAPGAPSLTHIAWRLTGCKEPAGSDRYEKGATLASRALILSGER